MLKRQLPGSMPLFMEGEVQKVLRLKASRVTLRTILAFKSISQYMLKNLKLQTGISLAKASLALPLSKSLKATRRSKPWLSPTTKQE